MASLTVGSPVSSRISPNLLGVGVIFAATALTAAVGSLVTAPAVGGWYVELPKPTWTPPSWVFGPVWTALYAMMAVAASVVWLARNRDDVCCPLTSFGVQLVLNLTWSLCFFGLQSPLLGFLDICLLWIMVALTTAEFFLASRLAGWLMVPYAAWVTFAAALNAAIVFMNA